MSMAHTGDLSHLSAHFTPVANEACSNGFEGRAELVDYVTAVNN